jgi:hypothetical protein
MSWRSARQLRPKSIAHILVSLRHGRPRGDMMRSRPCAEPCAHEMQSKLAQSSSRGFELLLRCSVGSLRGGVLLLQRR